MAKWTIFNDTGTDLRTVESDLLAIGKGLDWRYAGRERLSIELAPN